MSKTVRRVCSVVCILAAACFCACIFAVRSSGGFIDFSDLVRRLLGIAALVLATAAVLFWKSERRVRFIRLGAWAVCAAVIGFGVHGSDYYIPPAREIAAVEATVVDRSDEHIVLAPTVATPDFSTDDRLRVSLKINVPYPREPEIGDLVVAELYLDSLEGEDPICVRDLYDIRILQAAE